MDPLLLFSLIFVTITCTSSLPSLLNNSIPSSSAIPPPLSDLRAYCVPLRAHESPPREGSCNNALNKIGTSEIPKVFYARSRSRDPGIPLMSRLPTRYLSDDGLCAIDLKFPAGVSDDTSSEMYMTTAAREVIKDCVRSRGQGGRVLVPCKWVVYLIYTVDCHYVRAHCK